jgi:hypothetical protein
MKREKGLKPVRGFVFIPECLKCSKICKQQVGESLKINAEANGSDTYATLLYCKYKNK